MTHHESTGSSEGAGVDPSIVAPPDPAVILEETPCVLVLVSPDGTITWTNSLVETVGGFTPGEMVGTNMLDYVDADWHPESLASIGYAMSNPGIQLPTMLRMRTKDGGTVIVEATANNQLEHPELGGMLASLRVCDEQVLVDQVLESVAADDDLADTLALLHPVGAADTLRSATAVVLLAEDGTVLDVHAASPEIADLVAIDGPGSPWRVAADLAEPAFADVADLPTPLSDAARVAGFEACWAYPVLRPSRGGVAAVFVLWRAEPGAEPEPNVTMLTRRLLRLTGLLLERHELARHLRHAATHDQLTGLANRTAFFEAVEQMLASGSGTGVLYLDLDGFKPVNDRFGHGRGDQLLSRVAGRLLGTARPEDVVARLGGDEFAMACPGAGPVELVAVADRLLDVLTRPIQIGDQEHRVGVTIGLAAARAGEGDADEVVARADQALVSAKADAKGTWRAAPELAPG